MQENLGRRAPMRRAARAFQPSSMMTDLEITFHARHDGDVVLRCQRADGSTTWQRQSGPRAMFFPLHDLTHYAVETELGARDGFFGLIAAGWDIGDTDGKGARGRLPPEAVLVEHLVGLLSQERMGGSDELTAQAVLEMLAPRIASGELPTPHLDDATFARARQRRDELHAGWGSCPTDTPFTLAYRRPAKSRLLAG